MIHRNKIFTNFATSNKDNPVHSSSGPGRRPLTAETRVRTPDALQKARNSFASFSFSKNSYKNLKLHKIHSPHKSFISYDLFIVYITYNKNGVYHE